MRTATLCLAVCGCLAASPALAAKFKLDLQASDTQRARMDNGVEAIDSDMPGSSVRVFEVEEPVKKRGSIIIFALNASDQPVNLGVENISMAGGDGTPIETIDYERLVKEEKNRQMWAAIAVGLGNAANSMNAAQAGHNYGSVHAYGSGGAWAHGSYSGYNSGQAFAAQSLLTLKTPTI